MASDLMINDRAHCEFVLTLADNPIRRHVGQDDYLDPNEFPLQGLGAIPKPNIALAFSMELARNVNYYLST